MRRDINQLLSFGVFAMPQRATASVIVLLNKLPRSALTEIGMVAAAWAYLETEFDFALECLLSNRKAKGLHDDYIIVPFKTRLVLIREAAMRVYDPPTFKEFERVLGKVANAHGHRDPIIHGRFIPYSSRRFVVENHRHTGSSGIFRVRQNWSNTDKLREAARKINEATGTLVAFNRQHLPGSPPSWLDMPRPPYGKPAPRHPHGRPSGSRRRKH